MKIFLVIMLVVLVAAAGVTAAICINSGEMSAQPPAQSSGPQPTSEVSPAATPATPATQEPAFPAGLEDGGIFFSGYAQAYQKLATLSTEEKVGQMLLARFLDENAADAVRAYHPGGFVLFERDFKEKTKDEVIAVIGSCQEASAISMIMAVDEEGGTIVRISSNPNLAPERFLSPKEIYDAGGLDAVREDAEIKAVLLVKLGLNLNLAPVADVSQNPFDYIYARTLGRGEKETAQYVEAVIAGARSGGVSSALKHFPGYGNNANTHMGIAVDDRPLSTFEQSDFLPFRAGISAGAECVLVSHNIVRCMDPDAPASLSPGVHEILRDELGFTGLVLTDDLSMDAVRDFTNGEDPSVRAALAGNDMLLTSDLEGSYSALLAAVRSGELPMQTLDRAVLRILAMKYTKGLL